ncbi:MAG: penicillin-binding transpeptidase domain-containing protein [Bdellovibrionota bacterium]|nr:MAG: penicillin-binding transpeptidase domain-containing protein [Bdellovibrionota bacterium]
MNRLKPSRACWALTALLALLPGTNSYAAGPESLSFRATTQQGRVSTSGLIQNSSALRASMQSKLSAAPLIMTPAGQPELLSFPEFSSSVAGRFSGRAPGGDLVFYTVQPELQEYAETLVRSTRSHHVAIALMDPQTGRILAVAGKSKSVPNPLLHDAVPAASLFKVVTAAAALERASYSPLSKVYYRGGPYTLERWNYLPDPKRDRISMTLAEALGKSCNPVFGRIALKHLSAPVLQQYARSFGFNQPLRADFQLPASSATIPSSAYELSRTAAGFGKVYMTPIHAVTFMSTVANEGLIPRPHLIDEIYDSKGRQIYKGRTAVVGRAVNPRTASTLLDMMRYTTTVGTSRSEFMRSKYRSGFPVPVAAKTGTLRGTNPKGLNQWFIAAAPISNPKIAVAILVVDPANSSSKPSRMGRQLIERALKTL